MAGMSQSAPSDLFARPKARRREDWGQEKCVQRCDLGAWPEKMLSEVVQCVCEAQRADVTCPKSHS